MKTLSILFISSLFITSFLLFGLLNITIGDSISTKSISTNTTTNTNISLNNWMFANNARWNIVSAGQQGAPAPVDGSFMLASTYRDNTYGFQYETTEYRGENIANGSIDAWVYSASDFEITGIILRAGNQNASGCYLGVGHSTTLCQGYVLRLYTTYASLEKLNATGNYVITSPTQYNLPGGVSYTNTWWHLRLQAVGSELEGWVTQNITISGPPQLIATDTTYTSGFMGLTARTQSTDIGSLEYYDAVQITAYQTTKQNQSFEPNYRQNTIPANGWSLANSTRWNIMNASQLGAPAPVDGNAMLASTYRDNTYGFQYETAEYRGENITDGSIDAWVYSANDFEITGIILRAGNQNASGCYLGAGHSTTLCQGYVLRLYTTYASIMKLNASGDYSIVTQYNLSGGINYGGAWWHLRLQANKSVLEGWVTQNMTISGPPQLNTTDTTYTSGFMGLTARTQSTDATALQYYQAIRITSFNLTKQNESFENSITGAQNDGWVFKYPSRWTTVSGILGTPDGSYVLGDQNNAGDSGVVYDPVQFQSVNISDGSIQGWVYASNSNFKTIGVWIRTGIQTPQQSCTFLGDPSYLCTGYALRFYNNYTAIAVANSTGGGVLQKYNTGYISNTWWHVKLQAVGTNISAWVTTSTTFSNSPNMTVNDTSYSAGYAALSARTNFISGPYYDYFDAIQITEHSFNEQDQFFEPNYILNTSLPNNWVFANSTRWGIVSAGQQGAPAPVDGSFMLASTYRDNTYGFQYETTEYHSENITDGSIDAWVYSNNNFETTGVVLRAGNQNASGCYLGVGHSTTLCQGYVLRLYTTYASLEKLNTTGNYAITSPTQYNLPGGVNYGGVWWHLRLQAIGSIIEGWVTQNTTISGPPQLITTDTTYTSGFMGLIARTQSTDNTSLQYYDNVQMYSFMNKTNYFDSFEYTNITQSTSVTTSITNIGSSSEQSSNTLTVTPGLTVFYLLACFVLIIVYRRLHFSR